MDSHRLLATINRFAVYITNGQYIWFSHLALTDSFFCDRCGRYLGLKEWRPGDYEKFLDHQAACHYRSRNGKDLLWLQLKFDEGFEHENDYKELGGWL